jgi:DNA-binding transcriptional LysR family regulator
MNLRQLEVFHAIMTYGSISEAARKLNVAQPSVSTVLKHAEQTLGVNLFERVRGRLVPTPEAEQLFPEVDRVYAQLGLLSRFTKDLRGGGTGFLSMVGNPTLTNTLLPLAIARFNADFPKVRVRLQTSISASQIADRVVRREFDFGFIYGPNLDVHTGTETIGASKIACAIPAGHALAAKKAVMPADLVGQSLISFGVGSPIRLKAEEMFRDARVEFSPVVEASFSATACVLAQAGVGIAIIDPLVLLTENFPGLVVRDFRPRCEIELQLVFPINRPQSMLGMHFCDILRDVTAEHRPPLHTPGK